MSGFKRNVDNMMCNKKMLLEGKKNLETLSLSKNNFLSSLLIAYPAGFTFNPNHRSLRLELSKRMVWPN